MARWEGGLLATQVPAVCDGRTTGPGGVAVAQPFRNGLLLGVAAGGRAADGGAQLAHAAVARAGAARRRAPRASSIRASGSGSPWRASARSTGGSRGCAPARSAACCCAASSDVVLFPPAAVALSRRGGGPLRAATVDVRRDDVLVLAATPLASAGAGRAGAPCAAAPGAPAFLTARFERGRASSRGGPVRASAKRRSRAERARNAVSTLE